ncbi:hypothetical protein PIB30_054140 [Stylosanthes scabra]|uniref:Uncharacterized protein n=1 Tax=Stylosanthes scabra TaxID=79078 RepID=A0ABU6YJB8_9FABA|nr:hypothetical protein [Stylosanthes scabra]
MNHALLTYVLMTRGLVNLPHIMRDILLVRPTKHPRHLLPYPIFISRLAIRHEVPEYPRDEFYVVREVDMYVPYGDWRGERAWITQTIWKNTSRRHQTPTFLMPLHVSNACFALSTPTTSLKRPSSKFFKAWGILNASFGIANVGMS